MLEKKSSIDQKKKTSLKMGWILMGVVALAILVPGIFATSFVFGTKQKRPHPLSARGAIPFKGGSERCEGCHKREYELWANSNHALAERTVRPDPDNAAFDPKRSFQHGSQSSSVCINGGEFQIITMGFKTNVEAYRVERVIGRYPLRQFLTSAPGGRFQVHEASYDPRSNDWFNVYGDDRKTGEWGHWTGRGMNWNSRCAECHNTGLRKNYNEATDSYQTTMTEMSVGCEACHGDLTRHAQWRMDHTNAIAQDPTITRLSPVRIVGLCGSCHSRQDSLTGEFQSGDAFFDHYSLETLDQTERWYADGQVHDEDYEFASILSSKMYQRGVTCMNCHDMHSMKNVVAGNDLCMRCHNGTFTNAPVISPADHGHHKLADSGGQCIGCHMPTTVYMQRHARHDHGFTIPDPLLTKDLGIPNACNRCHADKTVDWSLDYTDKWYGSKMNRHTRDRTRWIAAAQQGESLGRDNLVRMLNKGQESPYWRAVACGLLWRWADEAQVKAVLLARLKDEHPFVREKAVRSLDTLVDSANAEVIAAIKPLLIDPARSVRVATAWTLKANVDLDGKAGRELQVALDYNADQPVGRYRKATLAMARKETGKALEHLNRAIEWDPLAPVFRCEIARVLSQLGQFHDAAQHLRVACQSAPQSADYQFQLGQTLAEAHEMAEAISAFNTALKIDPQYGDAWFNLGLALASVQRAAEALNALARAEAMLPDNPNIPYSRATILVRTKRYGEARTALNRALEIQHDFKPAQELFQTLLNSAP